MRLFISLSIFLFVSSLTKGQTFTKEFQFCERSSYSQDIFETESGEIIGVGGFDYKCQLLYKLNSEGELIDSLILTSPTIGSILFDYGQSLIEVNTDTFLYVATIREDDIKTADIIVTKFTGTPFDTLFAKRYKIDDYQQSFAISEINQGFRIFCRTDSINIRGGSSKGTALLLDIDKNGNLLNQRLYRDTFRFSGPGMSIQLPNNQTAITYKTGDDDAAFDENFLIVDSAFQLIWEKGISGAKPHRLIPQLVLSEDSTTIYYATQELPLWPRGYHGYVSAYNFDGSFIWDRFLCRYDFNILRMIRAKNGDLIGCGFWWDQGDRGRIFRLNKDGDLIFDRAYILPDRTKGDVYDYSEFLDIKETKTGDLLIAGVSNKKDALGWISYILKLDSSGCLVPSCDSISYEVECLLVNTNEVGTTPNEIQVAPNPADEIVTFRLPATVRRPKVNIVNAMGQVVERQKELGGNATLSIGHLPKGIYFFEVLSADNQRIGSGRFVVSR